MLKPRRRVCAPGVSRSFSDLSGIGLTLHKRSKLWTDSCNCTVVFTCKRALRPIILQPVSHIMDRPETTQCPSSTPCRTAANDPSNPLSCRTRHRRRQRDRPLCGRKPGAGSRRARVPARQGRRSGRIVNVASISGLRAGTGRMAYGTSKAALIAMTAQFAVEVADWGVTVNAIAPGPVDTPMVQVHHSAGTRSLYGDMVPMHRYGTA